jgi:hypothetical protein
MCPFCLATMGLVVAGTVSTGGLAALAVKVSRKKNRAAEVVFAQVDFRREMRPIAFVDPGAFELSRFCLSGCFSRPLWVGFHPTQPGPARR